MYLLFVQHIADIKRSLLTTKKCETARNFHFCKIEDG